jgi:catechol 2,3-dioxygenase-like lactoylglutathione lyase family enzyme
MKVTLISIPVRDQEKALKFYTEILGFVKKKDKSLESGDRWITLVSEEAQDGIELLLEPAPIHFEPSKVFQDALMESGIPYTQFQVESVDAEYERLTKLGVEFSLKPTTMGTTRCAVFNDTCGNNIEIDEEL